jgi:hypothetical protein
VSFLMKSIPSTAFLLFALSHTQITLAENAVTKMFNSIFSGSCKACISTDGCYSADKTCQRNCVVSLLASQEETAACKDACTSTWASCLAKAKTGCKDYCPPN